MLHNQPGIKLEYTAEGAIDANEILTFGTAATQAKPAGEDDIFLGIAEHDAADGAKISVIITGVAKVLAAGAVTRGAMVNSTSGGKAASVTLGTTSNIKGVIGVALSAATTEDTLVSVLLRHNGFARI